MISIGLTSQTALRVKRKAPNLNEIKMLLEPLKYLSDDLNRFLKEKNNSNEDIVCINNLKGLTGEFQDSNKDKIVITLLDVEHDTNLKKAINYTDLDKGFVRTSPPISFNLNLLFTAFFDDYIEALKYLSDALQFLQAKPVYNQDNSFGLDERVTHFSMELLKLNSSETAVLWQNFNTPPLPSLPYKLRLLTHASEEI